MSDYTDRSCLKKYNRVLIVKPGTSLPVCHTQTIFPVMMHIVKKIVGKMFNTDQIDIGNQKSSQSLGYKCFAYLDPTNYDAVVMLDDAFDAPGGEIPLNTLEFFNFMRNFDGDVWMYVESFYVFQQHPDVFKRFLHMLNQKKNKIFLPLFENSMDKLKQTFSKINYLSDGNLMKLCENSGREQLKLIAQSFKNQSIKIVKSNLPRELAREVCCGKADFNQKKFDISFATTDSKRFKQAKKYLDSEELSVQTFSFSSSSKKSELKLRLDKAKVAYAKRIGNMTKYYQFICGACRASYISMYADHVSSLKPERIYSCLMSDIVPMIPLENDPQKTLLSNKELAEFCYFETQQELVEKLKKLRDESFYNHILMLKQDELAIEEGQD